MRAVESKLIEMPLGKLQLIGTDYDPFIYAPNWQRTPTAATVARDDFDGRLDLAAGAGDHLLRAAPLFRPLVERTWALTVARWNKLPDVQLQTFLFGAARGSLVRVSAGLREIADGRCMYCGKSIAGSGQIDHFIPWSRHFDDGIENLVFAHARCNNDKRAHLAAENHLEHWIQRLQDPILAGQLAQLAADRQWESKPARTVSIARATYLNLPASYKLWVENRRFTPIDQSRIARLFTTP